VNSIDAAYGTDTDGIREIGSLDVAGTAARSATRYEPSGADMVRAVLTRLAIDYADFAFVDFGSGKGRVLIVAAGFPFKSVTGIEFSEELHKIATRNIAMLPAEVVRAGSVAVLCGDAAAFAPPRDNLVCYLYNPFGPPIISQVARRLASHWADTNCRVIVIYVDPPHRAAFEETGRFVVVEDSPDLLILTTPPADEAVTLDPAPKSGGTIISGSG
jgi:predicted RNA methylase